MTTEHIINEAVSGIESLRKDYEAAKGTFASKEDIKGFNEKHKATHEAIERLEQLNKSFQLEIKAKEEREQKLTKSLEAIEMELKAPKLGSEKKDILSNEMKAFNKIFSRDGIQREGESYKYLRTDVDTQGGYIAPSEYINDIIKQMIPFSPVRQVARIIPTSKGSVTIPTRESLIQGKWVGERQKAVNSNSTFGTKMIPVNKMRILATATLEMLNDAASNVEEFIRDNVAEEFARLEGEAFINGDGIEKPKGLLPSTTQELLNGGANLKSDSFYKVQAEIKQGYNLSFMLNRKTLYSHVLTLKGQTNDHYLLQLGLQAGVPSTIAGLPFYVAEDMPDVALDSTPILVGDFKKAYYIVDDVTNFSILRNPYSDDDSGSVRFNYYKRTGGNVVQPEALAKIKMS